MIGRHQIVFGREDFVRGISTNQYVGDGGFSNQEGSVNLAVVPGIAYAPADTVDSDTDTRLTGEIIASAPDMAVAMADNRLLVAGSGTGGGGDGNGTFYRYNGTKISAAALATDTTRKYAKGFTDIVTYGGEAYVTSKQTIARWQNDNTITQAWFTAGFDLATVPHPAIVFENNIYYGDGEDLWRQTAINSQPTKILSLSSDQIIMALGIDRGTGKMLISTTSTFNASNTGTGNFKLYWYDGFSNKTSKTVSVDDLITSFYSIGNTTYIGYGQNIGYINGSGIEFLRKLRNVTLAQLNLPYKHNFANIGATLYVVDGDQILAFGSVQAGGQKVFYYLYLNDITADAVFSCLFNAGNNKLGFGTTTTKFHTLDVSSIANLSNALDMRTNWYEFARPVILKGARIEFLGSTNTANMTLTYNLDGGNDSLGLTVQGGNYSGAYTVDNIIGFRPIPVTKVQFRVQLDSANTGFRKLVVHYDYYE